MHDDKEYKVYLDYGYQSEQLLFGSDDKQEAVRWAKENHVDELRNSDADVLEVLSFADSGELREPHAKFAKEDLEENCAIGMF